MNLFRKIFRLSVFKLKLNELVLRIDYAMRQIFKRDTGVLDISKAESILEAFRKNPHNSCFKTSNDKNNSKAHNLDIIVPCYNVEKYVRECLNSILAQKTNYDYRIICIDDGSTDRTGVILDEYSDKCANIVVKHQANKGLSGARNAGIELMDAEYVMFVDSDDYISEDAVEAMLSVAYRNNAAIVQGGYVRVTENGKIVKRNSQKWGKLNTGELTGFPCMKVIKSKYFDNLRFPLDYYFEDSIMAMILFGLVEQNNENVYGIENIVYYYRYNSKGIYQTARISPKTIDTVYLTKQLHNDRNRYGLDNNRKYYEFILYTIKLSYDRTRVLSDEINQAIFVVFLNFLTEYFNEYLYDNSQKTWLEKSFLSKNYKMYVSACNFE